MPKKKKEDYGEGFDPANLTEEQKEELTNGRGDDDEQQ